MPKRFPTDDDDRKKNPLEIATDALRLIECMTAGQVNIVQFERINTKALDALMAIRDLGY